MKNRRALKAVFLTVCISTLLWSCKKEEAEPATTTTTTTTSVTSTFTAKVDGVVFNENILSGIESTGANTIAITASQNSSFPSIGLSFSNTITAGTYTFDGSFGATRGTYNLGTGADDMFSAASGTGSLVITSHNTSTDVVEGTFSFPATPSIGSSSSDSYVITEGSFVIQY